MSLVCPIPIHDQLIDCGFAELGYFKIIILGIIQGITELLPISSTAHLRVVPAFLGWQDPGTPFTGAVQLASFFAVMIYFKKEIAQIFFGTLSSIKEKNYSSTDFKLGMGIIIGTIPVGIMGLLLKSTLNSPNSPLRSLYVIGAACIVMGILFIVAEKVCKHGRDFSKLTFKDCIIVGLAQVAALIPGVSRSGSTITAGLFLGLKRETAAAFSFILGVPVIVAAGLKQIHEMYNAGMTAYGWSVLTVGIITASIAAFLAVFGLMKYLESRSTLIFAWYRLSLGFVLILGTYLGWIS
ncbi:undecaprenyl-diphosphate phosphatase [Fluviispira multicolorata]|uniref:Undecaprenyl-diphosphatase n=1 Tax=Fluviispira multicolorata TaxID=2654512 RepID=A0A833N368_9BACT|nr:undecaprenyl-diphosphate phosphatase [Fluviispira multicolorata]KAB8033563.1 undecaprenyl-diphosphate phosphatase [Fluviispira multicolorata]